MNPHALAAIGHKRPFASPSESSVSSNSKSYEPLDSNFS